MTITGETKKIRCPATSDQKRPIFPGVPTRLFQVAPISA